MAAPDDRSGAAASVFGSDAPDPLAALLRWLRALLRLAGPAAAARRRPRPRPDAPDAGRRRLSGAYVVNVSQGETVFRWKHDTPADPGLEHQAVHHCGRARPLRQRRHARHGGAGRRRARRGRASGAATSTCAAAAIPPSAAGASSRATTGGRNRREAGRADRGARASSGSPAASTATNRASTHCAAARLGYATSIWVGPLSALAFNRGLGDERGARFSSTRRCSRRRGSTPRSSRAA